MVDTRELFELQYRRECYTVDNFDPSLNTLNAKLTRFSERDSRVSTEPSWFKPMRAFHKEVAAEADRLNRAQLRAGYLDYFFWPEIAS